jgi:hypothetical protein
MVRLWSQEFFLNRYKTEVIFPPFTSSWTHAAAEINNSTSPPASEVGICKGLFTTRIGKGGASRLLVVEVAILQQHSLCKVGATRSKWLVIAAIMAFHLAHSLGSKKAFFTTDWGLIVFTYWAILYWSV